MTSVVAMAMMESYALMILVMGTFFLYFCGMVWAFSNPKVSGVDELQSENAGMRPLESPYAADELTRSTYVRFGDDTESLMWESDALCAEPYGFDNFTCHASSREEEKHVILDI